MSTPKTPQNKPSEGLIPIADLWWEAINQPAPSRARSSLPIQSQFSPDPTTVDLSSWQSPNPGLPSPHFSSIASSYQQSEPEKIPLLSTRRKELSSILAAIIPAAAALVELLLLIYLLDVYLTLPYKDGVRERVSPWYSIWPYLSCVGSVVPGTFKALTILYAIFLAATFGVDLVISRKSRRDYWFRVARFVLAVVDGALMIAVAFSSVHDWSHAHLYLLSTKGFADISVKLGTYAIDHVRRRRFPLIRHDRAMMISKRWKLVLCFISIPLIIMSYIGIYGCHDREVLQRKGTACYILVALSAISDWMYSLVTVAFNASLAYDFYHAKHFQSFEDESTSLGQSRLTRTYEYGKSGGWTEIHPAFA